MYTLIHKGRGIFASMIVALLCATAFAPMAQAQTYYYPMSYQGYGPHGTFSGTAQSTEVQVLIKQLYTLIAQLQALQAHTGTPIYTYTPIKHTYSQSGYGDYDIDVETTDVEVDGDEATFEGEVEIDDAKYVDVWFIYGTDADLDEESDEERVTDDEDFSITVDDLDEDERYFVRAVAQDPSGELYYGKILAFTAGDEDDDDDDNDDDDNDDDKPEAETEDAQDVDENSAEIHGTIDMNDFKNGLAFFVYGQDEDAVEDVEDEDSYFDIDEDGDDLQKVSVNSDLDDERTFWVSIFNLDDDTEYFYRICVGYEDEDDDDTLECGDVESFETDND